MKKAITLFAAFVFLSGCNQEKKQEIAINQTQYCKAGIESVFAEPKCKPGQKIAFLPETFGNAQLPILFAARNCDLRYSIALTNGGVVCIFLPGKQEQETVSEEKNGNRN
ncbi:hypothetical protein [Tepidimonas taiwanensis]|uniref:hypothetical protein n=1 Tax=Tepidimonas taiwanensis TaxID=307486 RepID=UPI0019108738|nr:hypothetical protein [Tepidimonas taiwanensis]